MKTFRETNQILASQAQRVCEYLLPAGKRSHGEWVIGGLSGEAGKSMQVSLTGEEAGLWHDKATGEGGTLLDLWVNTRSCDIKTAWREALEFCGEWREAEVKPRKTYSKPKTQIQKLNQAGFNWLIEHRKISPEAIEAYKVASNEKGDLLFPYYIGGEVKNIKTRLRGQKSFLQEKNCEPVLFGWQAIPDHAKSITICEGEIDALSLHDYGFHALSVPMGGGDGGKQDWIENEFERLAAFDEVFLCMDMDEPGQIAANAIALRLGRERCRIVSLPHKDANDCLKAGVDIGEIHKCFDHAKYIAPTTLKPAISYAREVLNYFESRLHSERGIRLPWRKCGDQIVLRDGELSVWAGANGHGKTEMIGCVTLGAIQQSFRVCVASLEFLPHKWVSRLVRQASGLPQPASGFISAILNWLNDRVIVFDSFGTTDRKKLLEDFAYAAKRYQCKLFVIDNFAKCGIGDDDYNGQKQFIDDLTEFAKRYEVHVALVHHMRKGDTESVEPGKYDVKGSGGITDMCDTLMIVWRNKRKELEKKKNPNGPRELDEAPDCILSCAKQRNGEDEPRFVLWFDVGSHQFTANDGDSPIQFVDYCGPQTSMEK